MGTQATDKPQFSSPGPDDPAILDQGAPADLPKGTTLTRRPMENLVPGAEGRPVTELAATAAAEHARQLVQLKYMIAQGRPRDLRRVEDRLLQACSRLEFAEDATYTLPKRRDEDEDITGPSIRFSEEVVRCLGNILPEAKVVFDDEWRRSVQVSVTDLEDNVSYSEDVVVEKTVERKSKMDREVVGERTNRNNQKVYRVRATDEELREKQGNLVARTQRNLVVKKVAPSWLVELGMAKVRETQQAIVQKGLPQALERMRAAFESMGIDQAELEGWLGHPIADTTAFEYTQLRGVAAAIRDNQATWEEVKQVPLQQQPRKAPTQAKKAPAKEVKAEVMQPPNERPGAGVKRNMGPDPYLEKKDQPISNDELKALIQKVDERDGTGLSDLGANEVLRALLAKVRGIENSEKLFTASITYSEVGILTALIEELPYPKGDAAEEEARADLPNQGQ
jgi:hypothetical protein